MLAFTSMARRLSWALQGANVHCSSRRKTSLVALPSFDVTATVYRETCPENTSTLIPFEVEALPVLKPDNLHPDAQCHWSSNSWLYMNERFFSKRVPLELLGRGLVGEVWYEQAWDAKGSLVPFITKLFDYRLPSGTLGLHVELFLYASWEHLRPLQGKSVPAVIGTFSAPGGKIALLMEPPSRTGWREASMSDSDQVKEKIITAYDMVHSQGVLHNDVELRHILISDEGSIQIIDWQMAKSLKPNEDVGLKSCTQKDIDYETRKVKTILNYQGAYARELELATALYEAYEQGYPATKTDPRLGWFPHDEFDLMASGYWVEPDPEYTGGRTTMAPTLHYTFPDLSYANTQCRSKCQGGYDCSCGSGENSIFATTTTRLDGESALFHNADLFHMDAQPDTSLVFPPSPYSTPDSGSEPPPPPSALALAPATATAHEDGDDLKLPFLQGDRRAIRQFRRSFGFDDCDLLRWSEDEEFDSCSPEQIIAPSGDLLPRLGPCRPGGSLPPRHEQQATDCAKPLARHIQWRLTPTKSLPTSPLNPIGSRATMYSRPKATLDGSEDFVRLKPLQTPTNALRAFGAIIPGSTPTSCKVAPPPRTFSESTFQPTYAPPLLTRPRLPRFSLDRIIFELQFAIRFSDSKQDLLQLRRVFHYLLSDVLKFYPSAGPPSPGLQLRWNNEITVLRISTFNCARMLNYNTDCSDIQSARKEYVERTLRKARGLEQLIRLYCAKPAVAELGDDTMVSENAGPPINSQDDLSNKNITSIAGIEAYVPNSNQETPRESAQTISTQLSSVNSNTPPHTTPCGCNTQPTTRPVQYANVAIQTCSPPFSPRLDTSTSVSAPELNVSSPPPLFGLTDPSVLVSTSSVLPASATQRGASSSGRTRRAYAPYLEPSTRRLRSAVGVPESQTTARPEVQVNTNVSQGKPKRPANAKVVSAARKVTREGLNPKERTGQAHISTAPLPTPQVEASTIEVVPFVTEPRYQLRSHKRKADEIQAGGSDSKCFLKRRRT